jgi:hypothetical protein
MKVRQHIALALAATSLLVAGAPRAQPAANGQDCFYHRDTDSFTAADNQTINLRVGVNRYYQLKLFSPCLDLDFSQAIGMRSRGSNWICAGSANDVEIFTHSAAGRQRCVVSEVRRLTPEDIAAMPKRDRP